MNNRRNRKREGWESKTGRERGETAMKELSFDTSDARPKKQPVRRVPFALRQ